MTARNYPLHVMHGYEMDAAEAQCFLKRVAKGNLDTMRGIEAVSKSPSASVLWGDGPSGNAALHEAVEDYFLGAWCT